MSVRRIALLVPLALLLAACGSGSGTAASTTATKSTSATTAATQHLTVTPSSGLKATETVRLVATGFTPSESLVVTECANKGSATGEGDCNVGALKSVTADSSGTVNTTFVVKRGPFGANGVVCSKPAACIVTVTQETPTPTQDATATISFKASGS